MSSHTPDTMESLISLAKRRGFIFQGSEIYGGLAGTWDYGPLGVTFKNNIKKLWWKRFVDDRDDMYGVDAAILMNQNVWKASGHVAGFADPLVECKKCKKRFRADHLRDKFFEENPTVVHETPTSDLASIQRDFGSFDIKCPNCDNDLRNQQVRQFNMMFQTNIGATQDESSISYLRPETAQGMFVNFKNVLDTFHPKLPFGLAQIGKAFRNEIAPRDFLFRSREFEQMEIEYFVKRTEWKETFEHFIGQVEAFTRDVGLTSSKVHRLEVAQADLAHYSERTIDFEFDYPFGKKELYGLAYRTDFDLKAHTNASKVDLSYFDEETKTRFTPHCIEPSFGVDRTVLAVLCDAYTEDELGGEKRVYLKLAPSVAPYKVAIFPLLKNKPVLVDKAREIYSMIRKVIPAVTFDDNGNIGKRYRRQDEIGTPFCLTVDFDTVEKGTGVTIRNRDTGVQERVEEKDILTYLQGKITGNL